MSLLWTTATGVRMVPVQELLRYRPTDGDTWEEVHDNYDWDHPKMKEFVADVRRNGVHTPVPVNYDNDPPTVENGHTRILAAEKAGVTHVPVKDYEWFEDDPKPWR